MTLEVDVVALVVALSGLVTAVGGLVRAARTDKRQKRETAELRQFVASSLAPPPDPSIPPPSFGRRDTPAESPASRGKIFTGKG